MRADCGTEMRTDCRTATVRLYNVCQTSYAAYLVQLRLYFAKRVYKTRSAVAERPRGTPNHIKVIYS